MAMDNKLKWKLRTNKTLEMSEEEVITTEPMQVIGIVSHVWRLMWELDTLLEWENKERSLHKWWVAPMSITHADLGTEV